MSIFTKAMFDALTRRVSRLTLGSSERPVSRYHVILADLDDHTVRQTSEAVSRVLMGRCCVGSGRTSLRIIPDQSDIHSKPGSLADERGGTSLTSREVNARRLQLQA